MFVKLPNNESVSILIKDLTSELYSYSIYATQNNIEPEDNYLEVRLRVFDGSWELLTGDPQYDQDHRGHWSYGSLELNTSKIACVKLAKELIDNLN